MGNNKSGGVSGTIVFKGIKTDILTRLRTRRPPSGATNCSTSDGDAALGDRGGSCQHFIGLINGPPELSPKADQPLYPVIFFDRKRGPVKMNQPDFFQVAGIAGGKPGKYFSSIKPI